MLRYIKDTILTYSYNEQLPTHGVDILLYRFSKNLDLTRAQVNYLKQAIKDTDSRLISTSLIERISQIEKRMIENELSFFSAKLIDPCGAESRAFAAAGRNFLRARFVKGAAKMR